MILYSKKHITDAVSAMKQSGRTAHGFLLIGEKGSGRKTTALYIAKSLMCESGVNGVPCGKCRHCRRIDEGTHPDVIILERTGKMMIYNAEAIRDMYRSAYTKPNDCDAKVYILPDCENIQERTQNIMLKLIEEPPDYAYFIFTAESRDVFLPTILSRIITFGIPECSEDECRSALRDRNKYSEGQIDEAVSAFHGNIGGCIDYLENGASAELVKYCKEITECIINGDEYGINKALYSIGENREKVRNVLEMTDKIIRDACVMRVSGEDAELIGCYKSGSERLSMRLSFRRAENIHTQLGKYMDYCGSNVNISAAMSSLSGLLV
ncbi:MAG: DNA polymerase III subunit delta' [Oscillospiraceae bacterium]|nr:DNA polymerase III subunit delta' [Oscillospiraceae bacterium]